MWIFHDAYVRITSLDGSLHGSIAALDDPTALRLLKQIEASKVELDIVMGELSVQQVKLNWLLTRVNLLLPVNNPIRMPSTVATTLAANQSQQSTATQPVAAQSANLAATNVSQASNMHPTVGTDRGATSVSFFAVVSGGSIPDGRRVAPGEVIAPTSDIDTSNSRITGTAAGPKAQDARSDLPRPTEHLESETIQMMQVDDASMSESDSLGPPSNSSGRMSPPK